MDDDPKLTALIMVWATAFAAFIGGLVALATAMSFAFELWAAASVAVVATTTVGTLYIRTASRRIAEGDIR